LTRKKPKLPAEKSALGKKIAPIFWSKALPLAIGGTTIALILLWRAIRIMMEIAGLIGSYWYLDEMKAACVMTEGLMVLLVGMTIRALLQTGGLRMDRPGIPVTG
jgi:hypothetical protein